MNDQPRTELATIESPLDRRRVGDMKIEKFGGLTFNEYREAVEFSKIMTQARNSIPKYLKQNVGDCLAIVTQSLRWNLEPFWVAQHSYIARDNADSLIAYDAAVHAAIVLSRGNLKGRPRYSYAGEGDKRTCTISAQFIGEDEPHEYTTPPLIQCRPPKNADGVIKGSPLWSKDPDQQLGYYAIRNWGRRHCPEVLGGVYDKEEFDHATQDAEIEQATPNLINRLSGRMTEGQGFHPDNVTNGIKDKSAAGDAAAPDDTSRHHGQAHGGQAAGESTRTTSPAASGLSESQEATDRPKERQQSGDASGSRRKAKDEGSGEPGPGGDGKQDAQAPSARKPRLVKPETPAEAPKPASDEPAKPAGSAVEFADPIRRTGDEYLIYLRVWTAKAISKAEVDDRYKAERTIRNALGTPLTEDQLDEARKIKAAAEARIAGGK